MARRTLCCPKCHLVTGQLATHLLNKCMKNNTDEEREVVILQAQDHMQNRVKTNVVVPYDQVEARFVRRGQHVVVEVTKYLEVLGHFVTGQPSVVSAPPEDAFSRERSVHRNKRHLSQEEPLTSPSQTKSLSECRAILRVAKPHFLSAMKDAQHDSLNVCSYLTILNYLSATLNMWHCQQKSVVENLLVEEWHKRVKVHLKDEAYFVVYVQDYNRKSTQPTAFCLTAQEHKWFRIYFDKCRPFITDLHKDCQTKYFFLNSNGNQVYNQSNEMRRFQKKYGVRRCNISECRQALQTAVKTKLPFNLAKDCLSVSMGWKGCKSPTHVARTQRVLNTLGTVSPQPSTSATGSPEAGYDVTSLTSAESSDESSRPVTSDCDEDSGEAPSKKRRTESRTPN